VDRLWRKDKNFLGLVCGKTGTGKSSSSVRLAELIDPEFNVDRIVFTAQDFLKLIRSKELHKGSAVVLDEAGIAQGLAAREAMTRVNRALDQFLQGFRAYNFAVIFTVPNFMSVDTSLRRLAHSYFQTHKILRARKLCEMKCYDLHQNPLTGEIQPFYPRFYLANGVRIKVSHIRLRQPSTGLWKAYLEKKASWLDALTENTLEKMETNPKPESTRGVERVDTQVVIDTIISNQAEYVQRKGNRLYIPTALIKQFGTTTQQTQLIKIAVERKLNEVAHEQNQDTEGAQGNNPPAYT